MTKSERKENHQGHKGARRLTARAGMTFQQILASLTTTPAHLFGVADHTGRIAAGFDADLVFLGSDPAADITALANVRRALLRGRVLFDSTQP